MIKKLLLVLTALLLLFVVVIMIQPSKFHIERSATLTASTPAVFEQVNDFRNWEDWSPWATIDPDYETTYKGPEQGTGAIFEWNGNAEAGEGRMTILDSEQDEKIEIKLEFIRPFESTNSTIFTFKPQGDHTDVTWSISGQNGFLAKAFGLVMDMDERIGNDFEQGLKELESTINSSSAQANEEI